MVVDLSFIQSFQHKAYEPAWVFLKKNFHSNYTVKSTSPGTSYLSLVTHFTEKETEAHEGEQLVLRMSEDSKL